MKCIAAHTEFVQPPAGKVVAYVNASRDDAGQVVLSVRNRDGAVASISIADEAWENFLRSAAFELVAR